MTVPCEPGRRGGKIHHRVLFVGTPGSDRCARTAHTHTSPLTPAAATCVPSKCRLVTSASSPPSLLPTCPFTSTTYTLPELVPARAAVHCPRSHGAARRWRGGGTDGNDDELRGRTAHHCVSYYLHVPYILVQVAERLRPLTQIDQRRNPHVPCTNPVFVFTW